MSDRRYSDEEVSRIFERAAEAQQQARKQLTPGESPDGMTLSQLQEIGKEVGIAPELIAQAAKSVALPIRETSRKFLGLPIGVGRTLDLERKLTDDEWDRLVVDLRETFDAKGTIRHEGSFRQWTNGNLQALLEPTPTGQRLRLKTFKSDAMGSIIGGAGMVAASAIGLTSMLLQGAQGGAFGSMSLIGAVGAMLFAAGALRLPSWARLRQRQMEDVAERLSSSISD
ncbi:MAG TPA: hypothetical protein VKH19_17570, partial [Gemmatimonadaceae bacterium]|nr:hypothetical protein [Gemmatimonadaceae bacterium]